MAILCMHLVELDVFPWNKVYSFLKANDFPLNYITALLLRYILVGTMVMALFYVPGINRVFFPNLRRKVETKGNALQADT